MVKKGLASEWMGEWRGRWAEKNFFRCCVNTNSSYNDNNDNNNNEDSVHFFGVPDPRHVRGRYNFSPARACT